MEEDKFYPLIKPDNEDLTRQLQAASNPQEFNDLVSQLNAEMKKQELIRTAVFSDIQNKITAQLKDRLDKHADEFSNKDLVTYLTAVQNILDKSAQAQANTPAIAIQQNVVNVGVSDDVQHMSKESRDKIKDAVDYILSQQLSQIDKTTNNTQEIIDENDE